jgi:hypothetical protein
MADVADDRVDLTELDVITRYSLAVRTATADRDELIQTLRSDLDWLEAGRAARPARRSPAKKAVPAKAGAPRRGGRRSG